MILGFPPEEQRPTEVLNGVYAFEWQFSPDGAGTAQDDGAVSGATISYNVASWTARDKTVRVRVRLTGQLVVHGQDGEKDVYALDQTSAWREARLTVLPKLSLSNSLWWYNGANPVPDDNKVNAVLTAVGAAKGPFTWQVIAGRATVALGEKKDNTVQVRSTGMSEAVDDVTIELAYGDNLISSTKFTVRAPTKYKMISRKDNPLPGGFEICRFRVLCG